MFFYLEKMIKIKKEHRIAFIKLKLTSIRGKYIKCKS